MDSKNITKIKTGEGQAEFPSLIIDKSGRMIAVSDEFRKLIPSAKAHLDFFELFDEQTVLSLQSIFINARKFESTAKDSLDIKTEEGINNFEVAFSPLKSENNVYFLIVFKSASANRTPTEIKKIWISTSEIEKIVDDKKLLAVINKVKLTYPFTFIEKAKIQKEINDLDEYFWIKDTSGKYVIVNDKYAESLGSKSSQLENKYEQDFLPKYLMSLYKTVDSYISESTNAVVFEGLNTPIAGSLNKFLSIAEFPLLDLDNNVVAIIGFSRKPEEKTSVSPKIIDEAFYKNLATPVIIIDRDNKILAFSNELLKLFGINESVDILKQDISRVFEKGFVTQIENFSKGSSDTSRQFNYVFVEKGQLNTEVRLNKIFSPVNEFFSVQISFAPKVEHDHQTEAKAKMYDALITHTPEAMFIYEIENLKFLDVNDSALKLYGYKRSDFLNMDLTDLYAPEDIQTIIETGDSKEVPGSYSGPWRHKKNDGTSVLVELSRSTIDFAGKKAHLNVVRNVSIQTEIKKKLQIFESTYENTSDPIFVTDKDGFVTEINEQVSKRLGYSKKDLETRPFISLVSDDDRAKVNKNIFHSGLLKTTSLEAEFKKPSGTFQKVNVVATPIKNYSGSVDSYSLIVKPVEEISDAKDVKHTLDDVGEKVDPSFLSNVFHEILTPINVIIGFMQEISDSIKNPNEEQKEAFEIINENQKLLLQIMDNAVEYSNLEQKAIKFRTENVKFVDLLNELKENVRKVSESKKVELSYAKVSSSMVLETDRQKFISLISLFIKFAILTTKENSLYLSVTRYEENYCAVGIKDSQKTITPYLLKALNDIFSDDENLSRRNYGFSRFSVKLAKKLITLLSVRKAPIPNETEAEEYAFIIPLKFVVADAEKMQVETLAPAKTTEPKQVSKSEAKTFEDKTEEEKELSVKQPAEEKKPLVLSQYSCLYLEDEVDSQMLFKIQMKDLKSIEFAQSFESALPLLKTKKFDFIVMDINLQGEYNGLDALRIIQKMPGYQKVPIIASTAYLQPGARESFIGAGFTEFVSKPLLRDKLMEVLKNIFA